MKESKISVVTVCYNAAATIEDTILSVINQTYENIEYIIIDGGSTDSTVDIIKKYADRIAYWVSEPDKGIYDAMNKGIKVASGEWINFMNAGDIFYENKSIKEFMAKRNKSEESDVLYGYLVYTFPYGKFIRRKPPLKDFNRYMPIGHPASFVRTQILKAKNFDCSYKIAADYDFFYKIYQEGKTFEFVDVIVSDFESYMGVSNSMMLKTYKETSKVNGTLFSFKYYFNIIKLSISQLIKNIIKKINPSFVFKIQKRNTYNNQEFIPLKEFK